jgi:hypothetical protein
MSVSPSCARQDLAEVAHVEPLTAARTFHEVIGLGLSDAIGINARFDHRSPSALVFGVWVLGPALRPCGQPHR